MTSDYVTFDDTGARLHILRGGRGRKLLLCFHGYSNSAWMFSPFEAALGAEYSLISVDLPHHGRSDAWPPARDLQPADLRHLAHTLCAEYGVEKLSLLAFSLGGRVSLKMIETVPQRVETAVLTAPDGLRFNPLYYFVTRTAPGRALFSRVMRDPRRLLSAVAALRRRGVLAESQAQFVQYYLESSGAREFLGKAWPALRHLVPRVSRVHAVLRAHRIPVHIFAGRHDRVIPLSAAKAFAAGQAHVHLHILERGHRVIDAGTLSTIAQPLLEAARAKP